MNDAARGLEALRARRDQARALADFAPELLAALKQLVAACGDVRPYQMGVVGPEGDMHQHIKAKRFLDVYDAASAVLAKAEAA